MRPPWLGILLLIAPVTVQAGDCIQSQVTDPVLTYLFNKAAGDTRRISKSFGRGVNLCRRGASKDLSEAQVSALSKSEPTYWLFDGDHRCGVRFPFDQVELVSTEKLKKVYEDYIKDDLRVWVTSPKGESAILSKPYLTFVDVPQSMLDCFKRGPKDFSCPESMPRKACCRSRLMKRYVYAATFRHPFDPDLDITVQSSRPKLTVRKHDGSEEKLFCESPLLYF